MSSKGIGNEIVGGAVLVIVAVFLIYLLSIVGQAFSTLPGGAATTSIINSGISGIMLIVVVSGAASTIGLGLLIIKMLRS